MSSSTVVNDSINEVTLKEELCEIYYTIVEKLNNPKEKANLNQSQEKILYSTPFQIISYIKEALDILTSRENLTKETKIFTDNEFNFYQYENLLKKYEKDIRNLIQKNFEYKFQLEVVQCSLDEYSKMEDEFEEMKVKLKYEDGKFLDNDRKDNEILILRAENTNLKQLITKLEEKIKIYKSSIKEKQVDIDKLANKNEKILKQLAEAEKELNLFSSISININNHELTPLSSPQNLNNTHKNPSQEDQFKVFTLKKIKAQALKKHKHLLKHRNNSLNMLLDTQKADLFTKYFTNKHQNSNKKRSIDGHLMSNYNSSSTKCLKIKKVPFNLQQNRIVTSRNGSNKHQTIEKNNGNNVAIVKKGNRESQQKIIICNQENATVNLKNIFQKPSVSFG